MLIQAHRTNGLHAMLDQRGCPAIAAGLARPIAALLARDGCDDRDARFHHAAGTDWSSWHAMAAATAFAEAVLCCTPGRTVGPITTPDWPTKPKCLPISRLDCSKPRAAFWPGLPACRVTHTVDVTFAIVARPMPQFVG
jgi:dTDP-4-dehydrorhamnose reductase